LSSLEVSTCFPGHGKVVSGRELVKKGISPRWDECGFSTYEQGAAEQKAESKEKAED